ncbi:hypothetical protein B0H13DRAFT_1915585 [Mycena leptocephala]|nr:hypothetical protein B0H13DRAFT_1915585 [Mycena leptocephala]
MDTSRTQFGALVDRSDLPSVIHTTPFSCSKPLKSVYKHSGILLPTRLNSDSPLPVFERGTSPSARAAARVRYGIASIEGKSWRHAALESARIIIFGDSAVRAREDSRFAQLCPEVRGELGDGYRHLPRTSESFADLSRAMHSGGSSVDSTSSAAPKSCGWCPRNGVSVETFERNRTYLTSDSKKIRRAPVANLRFCVPMGESHGDLPKLGEKRRKGKGKIEQNIYQDVSITITRHAVALFRRQSMDEDKAKPISAQLLNNLKVCKVNEKKRTAVALPS